MSPFRRNPGQRWSTYIYCANFIDDRATAQIRVQNFRAKSAVSKPRKVDKSKNHTKSSRMESCAKLRLNQNLYSYVQVQGPFHISLVKLRYDKARKTKLDSTKITERSKAALLASLSLCRTEGLIVFMLGKDRIHPFTPGHPWTSHNPNNPRKWKKIHSHSTAQMSLWRWKRTTME